MILLTFNFVLIEAELKNNQQLTTEKRLEIVQENTRSILRILDHHNVKASFFIEISIVENLKNLIKAISAQGQHPLDAAPRQARSPVLETCRRVQAH